MKRIHLIISICFLYLLLPKYSYAHGIEVLFFPYLPIWFGMALISGFLKSLIINKVSKRHYQKTFRLVILIAVTDSLVYLFSIMVALVFLSLFAPYPKKIYEPVQWGIYSLLILLINILFMKAKGTKIITVISSMSNWRWLIVLTFIYPIFVILLSNILRWILF